MQERHDLLWRESAICWGTIPAFARTSLGSTAITVDSSGAADSGAKASELRYKPYGEVRYSGLPNGTGTDYRFTGQRQISGLGLYQMGARWIDPSLGRWLSADTLVPEPANPQSWNRFAYVNGNPLRSTDPSGHGACSGDDYDPACKEDFSIMAEPTTPKWSQWLLSVGMAKNALVEAYALPVIWIAELGSETQSFGPRDPLTKDIRNDPAIDEFWGAWAQADFPESFEWHHTIDDRSEETPLHTRLMSGTMHYARENIEMMLAPIYPSTLESQVDAIGGMLGSFDKISATEVAPGISRIEVKNEMGWRSATRIPGTTWGLLPNTVREAPGPGGTTMFRFFWYVESP